MIFEDLAFSILFKYCHTHASIINFSARKGRAQMITLIRKTRRFEL
jgi:hypothetical protein